MDILGRLAKGETEIVPNEKSHRIPTRLQSTHSSAIRILECSACWKIYNGLLEKSKASKAQEMIDVLGASPTIFAVKNKALR